MTSKKTPPNRAFVWIWLPDSTDPVVAGQLTAEGGELVFNYGRSYLARENAIPIHQDELPLRPGKLPLFKGLTMPGSLRDGSPDAWGRRVIINKLLGVKGHDIDPAQLDEFTYMLESGSDRTGALDFQTSPTTYTPRTTANASLEELQTSADRVEKGVPLTPEIDRALHHGSSIGGARPKALIQDGEKKYIAKFSAAADLYSVVKAEFVAMRIASLAGLQVAPVRLERASHKDVLLVERFDRAAVAGGWRRYGLISALTLLRLDEMMARYASYTDFAELIRHKFSAPTTTLRELFGRLVFNVLSGNTDDHARNHAALWDGISLRLSPAYDVCPQSRSGREASQAMSITPTSRSSRLTTCLDAASAFLLSREDALSLVAAQIAAIGRHWRATCELAALSETDRRLLWGRQFLNPYAFEGMSTEPGSPAALAEAVLRERG